MYINEVRGFLDLCRGAEAAGTDFAVGIEEMRLIEAMQPASIHKSRVSVEGVLL